MKRGKIMTDKIFGNLVFDDNFYGKVTLTFFGKPTEVDLIILHFDDEEDGISDSQYEVYNEFIESWKSELQNKIVEKIIEYYNEEERFSYGSDDDDEEFNRMWPELDTIEDMAKTLELDGLIIDYTYALKKQKSIYLTFGYTWGNDTDSNGICVEISGDEITDIGFRDIAF